MESSLELKMFGFRTGAYCVRLRRSRDASKRTTNPVFAAIARLLRMVTQGSRIGCPEALGARQLPAPNIAHDRLEGANSPDASPLERALQSSHGRRESANEQAHAALVVFFANHANGFIDVAEARLLCIGDRDLPVYHLRLEELDNRATQLGNVLWIVSRENNPISPPGLRLESLEGARIETVGFVE
jgi:hypothetical protein